MPIIEKEPTKKLPFQLQQLDDIQKARAAHKAHRTRVGKWFSHHKKQVERAAIIGGTAVAATALAVATMGAAIPEELAAGAGAAAVGGEVEMTTAGAAALEATEAMEAGAMETEASFDGLEMGSSEMEGSFDTLEGPEVGPEYGETPPRAPPPRDPYMLRKFPQRPSFFSPS